MDQSREVSIRIQKHPSFGLKDLSFGERKKVELQEETVKLRPDNDHDDHGDSFIISKRKRDAQREEESAGNELEDCGFPHRLSSNTWLLASSDHNLQRSNRVTSVVVPKKARSSNNPVRKKTSKFSSPTTEEHIETEIAELLYGLKSSSRNQDSTEKLQTNVVYENNKVDLMASKSSPAAESVEIEKEKLDDTKSCVTNKDIKKVHLESIDLMAPPTTDLELGNYNIMIEEDKETFKKNQDVTKIDIEVPNKDNAIWTNQQVNKTVSPAWSRNLPPLGYLPPPLQPIVETDKTTRSSSTTQQLVDFVLSPPQPKRCASHHYIARNIFLHQQLLRVNSSSLCGTKPKNVNKVPTPGSMITWQRSQEKKELVASKFPSFHTNKSPDARNSVDIMQMDQQGPSIMHQPSPSSPAAQNSSISIGLSSPHKQSYGVQLKQSHKLMGETREEKSAAIVGQKNVYSQNLTIPVQPKNENLGDSKQEPNLKGGFDFELVSSRSFAISFHSPPSVAWQGYYSAWNTTQQDDEKKINSGKSSSPSATNGPITTLVFDDDSSKYLSFVLSPENRTCLDHSMASSSQHLRQLHKQQNVQQQKKSPMVTQYLPQCNSPNYSFHSRSSKRRPLDSQHCYSGARKNFSSSCTNIFWEKL